MGPVDYLVVKFPGNKFSGEIAPELSNLERNKIIRIIDLAFVLKDTKGNILITEAKDMGKHTGDAFSAFAQAMSDAEWFSIDDLEAIAADLPKNRLCCNSFVREHMGNPFQGSAPPFRCRTGQSGSYPVRNNQKCGAEINYQRR